MGKWPLKKPAQSTTRKVLPSISKRSQDTALLTMQAMATPKLPNWGEFFDPLPKFPRKLRVCQGCVGVDHGEAYLAMKVGYTPVNVYDTEAGYEDALRGLFEDCHGEVPRLHMGKEGDVTKVRVEDLEGPVDVACMGPPCPPWSPQGKRKPLEDPRADVFEAMIRWIIYLIAKEGLWCVLLENVKGVLQSIDGQEQFYHKLMKMFQTHLPMFFWGHVTLNLLNYGCAQQRPRVILRGLHKMFKTDGIPNPLPPFGTPHLKQFLAQGLDNVKVESLTPNMRNNVKWFESQVARAKKQGEVHDEDIICCTLDRAIGKVYQPRWYINAVPTLTVTNKYLWLFKAGEVEKPEEERSLHRFLTMPERMGLQGKKPEIAARLGSVALAQKASGNAYPVPMLCAVLVPIFRAVLNSAVNLPGKPLKQLDHKALTAKAIATLHRPMKKQAAKKFNRWRKFDA